MNTECPYCGKDDANTLPRDNYTWCVSHQCNICGEAWYDDDGIDYNIEHLLNARDLKDLE